MLSYKRKLEEINKKLEKLKMGSCEKCIRKDWKKEDEMIFSEKSSRAIHEMGNMEMIELKHTSATTQCPSCLKHILKGHEHVSMWRIATTQSKYAGRNQNSICSVENSLLRTEVVQSKRLKRGHNPWQKITKPWGKMTNYTELFNWYMVGLTNWSCTSTTFPKSTFVIMHFIDIDDDMKAPST